MHFNWINFHKILCGQNVLKPQLIETCFYFLQYSWLRAFLSAHYFHIEKHKYFAEPPMSKSVMFSRFIVLKQSQQVRTIYFFCKEKIEISAIFGLHTMPPNLFSRVKSRTVLIWALHIYLWFVNSASKQTKKSIVLRYGFWLILKRTKPWRLFSDLFYFQRFW